jgi:hypothetical protein
VSEAAQLALIGVIMAVVTGVFSVITLVVNNYFADKRAKAAAKEVKAVAVKLETTTSDQTRQLAVIAETGEKTHTLVNSNMGVQLKLNKVVTRRVADLTKGTSSAADDEAAAVLAAAMYDEHVAKQAQVDKRGDRS